ncbi:hypothetical protein VTO42DRAFT_1422 [Malbranchea cinnamomea]
MLRPASNDDESDQIPRMQDARTVADIKATLALLHDHETSVTARLDALLASQIDFTRELGRLDLLRARLGAQASNARSVSNTMLSDAAATVQRISSAVKRLDLEQSRVKSTLGIVEQVAELKACVLGVAGSMGVSQDWETAAGYINRASKIPLDVVNSAFAAEMVPTAEVPDPPSVTLENASESLCGLFLREFNRAVNESDDAKITRFFKLFPLIGRSSVGLDVYGRYVCQGVAARARTNLNAGTGGSQSKDGLFYANALTKLFEHIAQIVDAHGGLVERHYGEGKMVRVIERLQVEADVQGGIILDSWSEDRHVDRKLTDIKSYAFTFLLQSFIPGPRASGTPRANSPAHRDPAPISEGEEEGVDMKEIDGLLTEMSVMLSRWSLYGRFLADKCKVDDSEDELQLPVFLLDSSLQRKIHDRVTAPYNSMTTFFLRRSVEKAFQLDEAPTGLTLNRHRPITSNPPYITSAVDDIMYIVNKVLQQSLATGQLAIITSVVPTIARVLGSDFIGMVQRKMRDETYPKPAVPGGQPAEATVIGFLVLINNLDTAVDYVHRIVQNCTQLSNAPSGTNPLNDDIGAVDSRSHISSLFPLKNEAEEVLRTLRSLESSFESKAQDLVSDGIQVLFNNIIKNRLRPILADAFRDVDYHVQDGNGKAGGDDTNAGVNAEVPLDDGLGSESPVRRQFSSAWQDLLAPISRILTDRTFDRLLSITLTSLSRLLEKRLWSYRGRINALGVMKLERDINGIVAAAVGIAGGQGGFTSRIGDRYRHREAFARCLQIVMVMGMEDEEWEDLSKHGGEVVDRLSAEERTRARAMVV